jgi:DNA-binding transcriptional ArsR family regulator
VTRPPRRRAPLPRLRAITTLAALRAVSDDLRHRILSLLITEPLAAHAIAARLRIPRTKVYYHLALLERHGFIAVAERRVVGRQVERIYRATAREFRVATDLIKGERTGVFRARARILASALDDLRAQATAPPPARGTPPALVARKLLHLRPAQLADLRRRLAALIEAADASQEEGAPVELAIALFPLVTEP